MFFFVFCSLFVFLVQFAGACTCDTNCTNVHDDDHGIWCMSECGFAIMKDAYDKDFLGDIQNGFTRWYDSPKITQAFAHSITRPPFVELGFPYIEPFNRRGIFYNRKLSQFMEKYYELANTTLEMVTFLHNPSGSNYQGWHMDAIGLPLAVKVYIPLVDVTVDMGPIELAVTKYDALETYQMFIEAMRSDEDTFNDFVDKFGEHGDFKFAKQAGLLRDCTVKGAIERGSIMAYINGAFHRGTPNLSGKNRTVLMQSYMTTGQAEKYRNDWDRASPKVKELLPFYRRLYHQYRNEDKELLAQQVDAEHGEL